MDLYFSGGNVLRNAYYYKYKYLIFLAFWQGADNTVDRSAADWYWFDLNLHCDDYKVELNNLLRYTVSKDLLYWERKKYKYGFFSTSQKKIHANLVTRLDTWQNLPDDILNLGASI